jgi:hypothetical protein
MTHHDPLTAAEIVKLLGGPTAISQDPEISAQRSAVGNWSAEGIPAKYWPALARRALHTDGAAIVTLAELERHVFPRKIVGATHREVA